MNNQQTVNIPMSALVDLQCPQCSNKFFYPIMTLKHYPGGLLSKNPITIPMPAYRCDNCLHVLGQPVKPLSSFDAHGGEKL
jgi:hypothetical protein